MAAGIIYAVWCSYPDEADAIVQSMGFGHIPEVWNEIGRTRMKYPIELQGQWVVVQGRHLYQVPTGQDGRIDRLGTVAPNGDRWDWCRHKSETHEKWGGERGGTEDTREEAKAKIMQGWAN